MPCRQSEKIPVRSSAKKNFAVAHFVYISFGGALSVSVSSSRAAYMQTSCNQLDRSYEMLTCVMMFYAQTRINTYAIQAVVVQFVDLDGL